MLHLEKNDFNRACRIFHSNRPIGTFTSLILWSIRAECFSVHTWYLVHPVLNVVYFGTAEYCNLTLEEKSCDILGIVQLFKDQKYHLWSSLAEISSHFNG